MEIALPVLERVERDGEGQHEPAVDSLRAGSELEDVAITELAEDALVRPDLLVAAFEARSASASSTST